jgi:hypothetical protein
MALEVKRSILLLGVGRLFSAFTVLQVAGRMNNYDREWYESYPLRFTCSAVRKCLESVKYQRTFSIASGSSTVFPVDVSNKVPCESVSSTVPSGHIILLVYLLCHQAY